MRGHLYYECLNRVTYRKKLAINEFYVTWYHSMNCETFIWLGGGKSPEDSIFLTALVNFFCIN